MTNRFDCRSWLLSMLMLSLSSVGGLLFAQSSISGVINRYAGVVAIGTDNVTVNAADIRKFSVGDTVLLMQMKAVDINVPNSQDYGTAVRASSGIGKHEFLVVGSINKAANTLIFSSNIINSAFDVNYGVQLIRVPSYNVASVPAGATLTAAAWDSTTNTGGVLAFFTDKSLTLYGNIDVSGKGFSGGAAGVGIGMPIGSNLDEFSSYNPAFDKYFYPAEGDSAGYKGEGLAKFTSTGGSLNPFYMKGKGANFSGGGGGNGGFSGGGGGSNYGAGGIGGNEIVYADLPQSGGNGGKYMDYEQGIGGLYMGGGGGGSTYRAGEGIASGGGNGGGIAIIVCDSIIGNGNGIYADGGSPTEVSSGTGGAGGGGGGGTVAVYTRGFTDDIAISAKGGAGGDRNGDRGNGGGGGGGYITTAGITLGNESASVAGGAAGNITGMSSAKSGNEGRIDNVFEPLFNGFLFNTIWSSVSGTNIDSVCSDVVPAPVVGTTPTQPNPCYVWQKSYDLTGAAVVIPDATEKDYTPVDTESRTHWIRRIVKDNDLAPTITDTSKWVQIIVQPAIEGNIIGNDDVICYGMQTAPIVPANSGPSQGNGIYEYRWVQTNDILDPESFHTVAGVSDAASFTPPALYDTTYYKRIVTSGRCESYSNTVTITVLSPITGNHISMISGVVDTVLCVNSVPNMIRGNVPPELAGGLVEASSYAYRWSLSVDGGSSYTDIPNAVNADYQPEALVQNTLFRRHVISGECSHVSNAVEIRVLQAITNNIISGDQTVCYNTVPKTLTGTMFEHADPNIYSWLWQQKTADTEWADAAGVNNEQHYSPPALLYETMFRRIVFSGYNNCCCDTSNVVTVGIHELPAAYMLNTADTSICEGETVEIKLRFTGLAPFDVVYNENDAETTVNHVDEYAYTVRTVPSATGSMTTNKYSITSLVDNNGCSAVVMDGEKTANIYKVPNAYAGDDGAVCGPQYKLSAVADVGSGLWTFPAEVMKFSSERDPETVVVVDSSFKTASVRHRFIWKVTNWQCVDADTVWVTFYNRIEPVSAGKDTAIMTFDNVVNVASSALKPFESGQWSVIEGTGSFRNSTSNITDVKDISLGSNIYRWTVVNGECMAFDDIVIEVFDVVVPEGISPNGDGVNDVLTITGFERDFQVAELVIVNGAGTKVYSTSNKDGAEWLEWDGTNVHGEAVEEGTYYYILKVTSLRTGVMVPKSGFIVLKRK